MRSTRVSSEIVAGVYKIENIINGNLYVGSSKDVYGRWVQHKRELKKNSHHSRHLQRAWNQYGEENFIFNIIETVKTDNRDVLFDCEQKWYDYYLDNGIRLYNTSVVAKAPITHTTIEDLKCGNRKISYEQFESICYYLSNTDIPIPRIAEITKTLDRTVYEIYFKNQYVELTKNMVFIHRTTIGTSQEYCAKLSRQDVEEIIDLFKSGACILDLSMVYNVSTTTLSDIYYKRTWTNLTDGVEFAPLIRSYGKNNKPIMQYDLSMNCIAEYKSAREAEIATGIGYRMISRVCNYQRPYTHGFIFRFKDDPLTTSRDEDFKLIPIAE